MRTLFQLAIRFILTLCLVNIAVAQDNTPINNQRTALTVTAYASSDRVRFTSPSSVVQIRLEVYNSTGKKVFDNDVRGGNVLDWHFEDAQAEPVADDTYLCAVTVKSLSGKLIQRIGSVTFEKGAASVKAINASQMTTQQSEAVGPVEENASLTVLKEDERQTATVIAHNGEEGQLIRGRGALTFRIGDFFSGKDVEQMRLTPEGSLGIGITHPQAKLDVDGLIRASQGIVFPDGSIQFSAARKTFGASSLRPDQSQQAKGQDAGRLAPDTSGTGTTGKIPKWLDGPSGVLTDSNISEVNGSIGINGTPNTNFKLDVNGSVLFRGSNPGFNLVGLRPAGNQWVFQTVDDDGRFRLFSQDNVNPGVERFNISLSSGNVGIGTTGPNTKLTVWTQSVTAVQEGIRINNPVGFAGNGNGSSLVFSQDRSTSENFINATIQGVQELADSSANGYLAFSTKSASAVAEKMRITSTGNVGVGTASPQARLDVRGNVKLGTSGQLYAPGGEENLRIIRGVIGVNGNIIAGTGFSVSHPNSGEYHITFDTPFSDIPAVTATAHLTPAINRIGIETIDTLELSATGVGILIYDENDFADSAIFQFIAIGSR